MLHGSAGLVVDWKIALLECLDLTLKPRASLDRKIALLECLDLTLKPRASLDRFHGAVAKLESFYDD